MHKKLTLLFILVLWLCIKSKAQDSSKIDKAISLPDKLFSALDKKTRSIEAKLDKQTDKYLSKLQKQETKLKKKLWRKDSVAAKELFGDIEKRYANLKNTTGKAGRYSNVYSGHLDSLSTALNFLENKNLSQNIELQKALSGYKDLQSKLNATEHIKKSLQQRQQMLKEQFLKLGMVKKLKQFRKQVYYYQTQVKEYKELFEDPNKFENALLTIVQKIPQFKDFFTSNSTFGRLFGMQGSNISATQQVLALQTRAAINQSIIERFGAGPNINQILQQNIQSAQGQVNSLRNQMASLGSETNSLEMPGFKPNNQKTKSFFKRLEYGTNFQTQRSASFFPATTDIALSVGYKLNDKSILGIGASYKVGWGKNIQNIAVTSEGVGFRSYADMKLKGNFYVSGGFEYNYQKPFSSVTPQFNNLNDWQKSGLVGLSKIVSIKTKLFKKTRLQLLWDFLSYQQFPKTAAFKFRIGYSL